MKKKKILVTGGSGYIGTHTIVDLMQNGYQVINLDNHSRSLPQMMDRVEQIVGEPVKTYHVDLCNFDETFAVFQEHPDIQGIIHFAAFKAVGESVEKPLLYFENNLVSLINLLKCTAEFKIPHFVFSSSCTVYGNPDHIPVTEETSPKPAESPYGYTKQMGEQIVSETVKSITTNAILLRYFNPVGAHPSGLIGELPLGRPQNLVPAITQTAIGKWPEMTVHGNDYDTRDGSCIRDYIHVCDLAHAHTLAIRYLEEGKNFSACEVFNLGTGTGYTVLEAIDTFERVSGVKLPYRIGPRRSGDVIAIFANNDKARDFLGWNAHLTLEDMMRTAWIWEQNLQKDEVLFNGILPGLN
jgi:UDP-glucose 4-epimerase